MTVKEAHGAVVVDICGREAWLLPEKVIFFPKEALLVAADLHIGKTAHFRKNGLAVPSGSFEKDILTLDILMKKFRPRELVFIGDLFHSIGNSECDRFLDWVNGVKDSRIVLVRGNHDLLPADILQQSGITIFPETYRIGNLVFRHEPPEQDEAGCYHLCGHIHPAVRIYGKARQSISAPCFYFTEAVGILPAFGSFTGNQMMNLRKGDKVFVVGADTVWEVPS